MPDQPMDLNYDLSLDGGERKISERVVQKQVGRYLKTIKKVRFHKRQAGLSQKGEADIYGCYKGVHFECELKAPGAKPTELQTKKLLLWAESGAVSFWVCTIEEFIQVFENQVVPRGNYLEKWAKKDP